MASRTWARIGYSAAGHSGLRDVWLPLVVRATPVTRSLLAGCAFIGVGIPHEPAPSLTSARVAAPGEPAAPLAAYHPPQDVRPGGGDLEAGPRLAPTRAPRFRPLVRIEFRDVPVRAESPGQPMPSLRAKPPAPLLDVPAVEIVPLVHPPSPVELAAASLRKVDVEQIAQVEGFAPPRASEGDYASGTNFAARAHAMQIAIPPLELTEADTAVLMAEAPVEMTVRLGSEALGSVSFRMSEQHGIDVQLSGLLDLVSDRFEPGEFARLRASNTADSFVSLEQLRAAGLNLSYDPVYDELQLSG